MDIHNGKAIGPLVLSTAPSLPNHAARLQDITAQASAAAAPIFITGISGTSGGNVGNQLYLTTIPANQVMTEATIDTGNVRVSFLAESGSSFYNPTVTYTGGSVTNGAVTSLTESPSDRRLYNGYVDVVLTETGDVVLTSSTGATATVHVVLAIGGPAITSVTLGAYPGAQTELKAGDTLSFTGVAPNTAVSIQVLNAGIAASGSATMGAIDSAGAGSRTFSGTMTVTGARSGAQTASFTAKNQLNTTGNQYNTVATRTLNHTVPTIATPAVTYPGGQEALKSGQAATVVAAIGNADTIVYAFASGTVDNNTTIASSKTVNCTANLYNVASNNYTITATKASNGAVTTSNSIIACAGVAEQISINITGSPARLQSAIGGKDYVVNLTSNQTVHSTQAPTLVAPVGTWQGTWAKAGNTWSRTLRINEGDTAGATAFTSLSIFNKALVETTAITAGASYTVGGFTIRTITFPAFAQYAAIGTAVSNNAKVHAQYAGTGSDLALRADTTSAANSFTLVNSSGVYQATGGTHLFISDLDFANANTSGTLQLTIVEDA